MQLHSVGIDWWQVYSEALCNSRGRKTEWQELREGFARDRQIKRDLELAIVRNMRFGAPIETEREVSV